MLLVTELGSQPMWRLLNWNVRAIIVSVAIAGCAPAARAQEQVAPHEYIVVGGGIKPETVSLTLQESCFGTQFLFVIVNRPNGSFLVDARRGGRPPQRPDDVKAVRRFLASIRNVRFRGTKCVSADEFMISLGGLTKPPPPGITEQVSQMFTIRF